MQLLARRPPLIGSWRDHILRRPDLQRVLLRLPLVGALVRRKSRTVFDLLAGFTYSQVLLASVELGLLERLSQSGPLSLRVIADFCGLSQARAELLLEAGASLDLFSKLRDGRWSLATSGAVIAASPAMLALVRHHRAFYEDLADPVALLRASKPDTKMRAVWAYVDGRGSAHGLSAEQVAGYSDLMEASQPLVAEEVVSTIDFSPFRCVLDVGGGTGAFLGALARRAPHLDLKLFDVPAVADLARARLLARGLPGVQVAGGDFFVDPLPPGADLISLVRVLYDHPDQWVLRLLQRIRAYLATRGGTLLIAEPMSGLPGAQPVGAAYFGLYLMAMGGGRARSPEQLRSLLKEAGFGQVHAVRSRLPIQTGLLLASCKAT